MAKSMVVFACLPSDINSPSTPQPKIDNNIPEKPTSVIPTSKTKTTTNPPIRSGRRRMRQLPTKLQQQLTLVQIERAVGAGSYRDSEPKEQQKGSIFRGLLPNSDGAMESSVERKIRETGEWLANETEEKFQSSGKSILMFTFQWVLPIYIFLFLVATGVVRLPFSTPFLDDLIM